MASDDAGWICGPSALGSLRFIDGSTQSILPGVTAVKVGGHFDGSLVMHWEERLFIADTLWTVPVRSLFASSPRAVRQER